MAESQLAVQPREETGGLSGKKMRREGLVPAVVYGHDLKETVHLAVNARDFDKALKTETGRNTLITLQSDIPLLKDKAVLVQDWQIHPLSRRLLHIDFIVIDFHAKMHLVVPVELTGKAVGLIKGGIVQQIRAEIDILCLPKNIPPKIEVDITNLDLGDSIHVEELQLPEGVEVDTTANFTIVTCVAPTIEEEPEPEEGEEAEEGAAAPAEEGEEKEESSEGEGE